MIAVALAQIRIHWARFLAIGLGIALAAGFVATTIIISSSLQASLRESVGNAFSNADLVVIPGQDVFVDGREIAPLVEPLSATDGVDSVAVSSRTTTSGRGSTFSESTFALSPSPADPGLDTFSIVEGSRPLAITDLVLDETTAQDLGVGIGDEVRFSVDVVPVENGEDDVPIYRGPSQSTTTFTVVGIADMGVDPSAPGMNRALTTSASYQEHFASQGDVIAVQVALDDSADPAEVRRGVQAAIDSSQLDKSLEVMDVAEATEAKAERLSGGNDVIAAMLLVFAGISVIVAILVVSNTFSVIVAGRRREFALLRCLGASRTQIYASVVAEGGAVGLIGSVLGVLGGTGFSYALSAFAKRLWPENFAHSIVEVPVTAPAAGIAVGVLLTILATIRPARSAIAVTPLEALQPFDASFAPASRSRPRQISGWSAIILGIGLLTVSLALAASSQGWVLGGALGGALIVTGLVISSAQIIPPIVAGIGELVLSPWGVPGRLATLNTLRNRRRTATTASALIIGVTLVSTILVGGLSTKATLAHGLDERFPVDVAVPLDTAVDEDALDKLRSLEPVSAVAVAHRAQALDDIDGAVPELYVIDPEAAASVLGEGAPELSPGRVIVPEDYPASTVRAKGLNEMNVPVEKQGNSNLALFTTTDVGNDLGVSATTTSVLVKLSPDVDVAGIFAVQSQIAEILDVSSDEVTGSAIARGVYSEFIDVLLVCAVVLLLVAVLIALLGVSNTVSLSVIERRRENALMRALGLSIAQLRALLALEAVLISSVAALIGIVLGGGLGIVGTRLLTIDFATALIVDWSLPASLGILAVAVIAGLLSALAPARRAARLSPVEGLKHGH